MSENENTATQTAETTQAPQSIEEAAAQAINPTQPLGAPQQNFAEKAPSEIAPEPAEMLHADLVAEFKFLQTQYAELNSRVSKMCTALNLKI